MATKEFLSATKPLARSRAVVAVVVAVGVALAVGVLSQQPGAQAQDATVGPSYTVKDLGTLGGPSSSAFGINDAGQVVGESGSSHGRSHAFLYERSATPKMQDLNSLIRPHSGWSLEEARAINQRGQIVGLGERNGHYHAFLLTPRK